MAPPEVAATARNLKEGAGMSPRVNCQGDVIVSEMFLMHCEAATVSEFSQKKYLCVWPWLLLYVCNVCLISFLIMD